MASNRTNMALGQLVRVLREHEDKTYTDGQLLTRFVAQRDEEAFVALVRRHGTMVLAVCRRILGNAADADDAFQTSFLVLVRKARSLRSRSVLGDWLHGVAKRSALKARASAQRRRAKEQAMARSESPGAEPRDDWLSILDEELSRLPEKYRLPIILCDLEGRTRQEAARQLRWPEGTVAGRLARARELLAKRLMRRGVSLPAAGLAAALPATAATASVSPTIATSTIKAACLMVVGQGVVEGVISAKVVTLTGEVMKGMLLSKLKVVGVVLVVCALGGGGWVGYWTVAQEPIPSLQPKSDRKTAEATAGQIAEPSGVVESRDKKLQEYFKGWDKETKEYFDKYTGRTTDPKLESELSLLTKEIRTLLMEKRAAARAAFDWQMAPVVYGRKAVDQELLDSSKRLMDADVALATTPKERLAAMERHWHTIRNLEVELVARAAAGSEKATPAILEQTKFARLEVEIEIAKERKKAAN